MLYLLWELWLPCFSCFLQLYIFIDISVKKNKKQKTKKRKGCYWSSFHSNNISFYFVTFYKPMVLSCFSQKWIKLTTESYLWLSCAFASFYLIRKKSYWNREMDGWVNIPFWGDRGWRGDATEKNSCSNRLKPLSTKEVTIVNKPYASPDSIKTGKFLNEWWKQSTSFLK